MDFKHWYFLCTLAFEACVILGTLRHSVWRPAQVQFLDIFHIDLVQYSAKKVPGQWTLLKVQFFQKCFIYHIRPNKKHIIGSSCMSSFWYRTCKIWLINNKVLTIWMETGIHFEKLQMLPFINIIIDLLIYHLLYSWMASFATFKNVPVSSQF